jgi:hypothetical protein
MPSPKVQFAKIVGSPTQTHWSQVYSAGSLHAVLSLSKESEEKELSLSVAGKGIINNIEAEFFTLEEKNLNSIQEAIKNAISSTPEEITVSLAFAYLKDDVMYLFTVGSSNILVKRGGKTGILLKGGREKKTNRDIHAGSGFVSEGDVFALYTHAFATHVSEKAIEDALALDSLSEAEEELMPHIHNKEAGDAGAIFIQISSPTLTAGMDEPESEEKEEPELPETAVESPVEEHGDQLDPEESEKIDEGKDKERSSTVDDAEKELPLPSRLNRHLADEEDPEDMKGEAEYEPKSKFSLPTSLPSLPFSIPNKKVLVLALAVILAVALGGGIWSVQNSREQQKINAEFQSVYDKAMKDYEVGESLEGLNKEVAKDNFLKARKTIDDNKDKFKEGSEARSKLDELAAKITAKIGGEDSTTTSDAKEAADSASPLLAIIKKTGAIASAKSDNNYFYLTKDAVYKTNESGEDKDEAYKNDDDWSNPKGLGAFGSNLYVLDQGNDLLKLTAGSDGYGVSSYLKGDKPDLDNAEDMAIDSSVYILFGNGAIQKYTRGEKDSFSVSALPKPMKNPTRIFTNEELDNVYVLDKGNARVLSFDKSGVFKNAYASAQASSAKAIDVNEDDKKIYLLSGNKIYEIAM